MQDLINSLKDNCEQLKAAIKQRYECAINKAGAEYEYRTALGRAMADQKAAGMAATALYDYCRGLQHIAFLRSKRDEFVAQEEYLTELIIYYRTEIRIAEKQLEAERKGL